MAAQDSKQYVIVRDIPGVGSFNPEQVGTDPRTNILANQRITFDSHHSVCVIHWMHVKEHWRLACEMQNECDSNMKF